MKRSDLSDENKKKYDQIVNQMMEEIERIEPLEGSGHVLSQRHEAQRRSIENKYLPQLRLLLSTATA